jgi:alpha-galactosidase
MLPIGRISLGNRPHGPEHWSKFTLAEQYTLLSLWIISRSPLVLDADLVSIPESTLSLITNPEVIAVNQNSTGNKYLALFNHTDSVWAVNFRFLSDSLSGKFQIRDLWKHQNKGIYEDSFRDKLQPQGAGLCRLIRQ